MHPRNRHQGGLDFRRLTAARPEGARFVAVNQWGNESVDFADPAAVKWLNTALLSSYYGVTGWELPAGYLCPSVPGRADVLHALADLLSTSNQGVIPRGPGISALDIGTGASCVYPLIGQHEYGWRFVGSDIDPVALASAQRIVQASGLQGSIELRLQASPSRMLEGLVRPGELFDVSLCNPPFHASAAEAAEGSRRKWRNLGKGPRASPGNGSGDERQPKLNFGGQNAELWCPGGESRFVARLVEESARDRARCFWFTSLVSKSVNLPAIRGALRAARVVESRTLEMEQGQKKSRLVAWTFLGEREREEWRARRWQAPP